MANLPDYSEWLTNDRLEIEESLWATHPNNKIMADVVLDLCSKYEINSMIEFRCGTGWIPTFLPSTLDYLGVDKNPMCIEKAQAKNPSRKFALCDIRDFEPVSKDLVCSLSFLKHIGLNEWEVQFKKLIGMGKYSCFTMNISNEAMDDGTEFPHSWVSMELIESYLSDINHSIISTDKLWDAVHGYECLFQTSLNS